MTEPVTILRNWRVFSVPRTLDAVAQWLREHPGPDIKPAKEENTIHLIWLAKPSPDASGYGHPKFSRKHGHDLEHTDGAFFDIDGPAAGEDAFEDALDALERAGLGYIYSRSHNAGPDAPWRGHIQLVYDAPCPAPEHQRLWQALHDAIFPKVDRSQSSPARGRNAPRRGTDVEVCLPPAGGDGLVNVRAWLARAPVAAPRDATEDIQPAAHQRVAGDAAIIAKLAEIWQPDTTGERAFGALGGVLYRLGVSEERAEAFAEGLADAVSTTHPDPVGRVLQAYEGLHELGWPTLKSVLKENGAGLPEETASVQIDRTLDAVEKLLLASVAPEKAVIADPLDQGDILSWVGRCRTQASAEVNATLRRVAQGFSIDKNAIPPAIESLCKGFPSFGAQSIADALSMSASHSGVTVPELVSMVTKHRESLTQKEIEGPTSVLAAGVLTRLQTFVDKLTDLRFNELTQVLEFKGERWQDADTSRLRVHLEQAGVSDAERPISVDSVERALLVSAMRRAYHPVKEYLESLPPWDGTPRLGALFSRYMRCEDTPLNAALGVCVAIAAVARLYEPGCKHDLMPILYGEQGGRKSSAIRALAGGEPAYSDAKLNVAHRSDAYVTLQECWIYECAELHSFDRADQNVIKNLITQRVDRYLPAYGRNRVEKGRSSIMLGTTNEEFCLKDFTGNRRHPVIRCLATEQDPIDTALLERDRNQLWAEALHRYRAREQWWLDNTMAKEVEVNNQDHLPMEDPCVAVLLAWMENPTERASGFTDTRTPWTKPDVTLVELMEHAFGIDPSKQDKALQTRVGGALKRLGIEGARTTRVIAGVQHRTRHYPVKKPG